MRAVGGIPGGAGLKSEKRKSGKRETRGQACFRRSTPDG
jgi:hypothetical protein